MASKRALPLFYFDTTFQIKYHFFTIMRIRHLELKHYRKRQKKRDNRQNSGVFVKQTLSQTIEGNSTPIKDTPTVTSTNHYHSRGASTGVSANK